MDILYELAPSVLILAGLLVVLLFVLRKPNKQLDVSMNSMEMGLQLQQETNQALNENNKLLREIKILLEERKS